MTDVTITIAGKPAMSAYSTLAAFLHDTGGPFPPKPLRIDFPNEIRALPDGLYHVSLAGERLDPGVPIDVTFAANGGGTNTKDTRASANKRLGEMLDFFLDNGAVL